MTSGKAYQFVTAARHKRNEQKRNARAYERVEQTIFKYFGREQTEKKSYRYHNDNSDEDHKENERRAAARMETTLFFNVLNGQFVAVFVAENGFVFGAVIHKRAFYVFHERNARHISDKNEHLYNARNYRHPDGIFR